MMMVVKLGFVMFNGCGTYIPLVKRPGPPGQKTRPPWSKDPPYNKDLIKDLIKT